MTLRKYLARAIRSTYVPDNNVCTWQSTNAINPAVADNCTGYYIWYKTSGALTTDSTEWTTAVTNTFPIGTSTVTYYIKDASNNKDSCSLQVVVEDCQNPNINCSNVTNAVCGSENVAAWISTIIQGTISDNCTATNSLVFASEIITDIELCGNTVNKLYVFRVTDAAGNSNSCVASYTSIDNTVPTIST
ncbi:MAG: HYR domain-containing protein, partial [Saprospiraceae bacterium]|nr:HYR domain-containing protein [Saprospiraceae bacterium]